MFTIVETKYDGLKKTRETVGFVKSVDEFLSFVANVSGSDISNVGATIVDLKNTKYEDRKYIIKNGETELLEVSKYQKVVPGFFYNSTYTHIDRTSKWSCIKVNNKKYFHLIDFSKYQLIAVVGNNKDVRYDFICNIFSDNKNKTDPFINGSFIISSISDYNKLYGVKVVESFNNVDKEVDDCLASQEGALIIDNLTLPKSINRAANSLWKKIFSKSHNKTIIVIVNDKNTIKDKPFDSVIYLD